MGIELQASKNWTGLLSGMHFQWLLKKDFIEKVPWNKDPKKERE